MAEITICSDFQAPKIKSDTVSTVSPPTAKDEEALYSQQKQDWELTVAQIMQKQDRELTVAQIMNSLLPNSDLNWRK